MKYLVRGWRRVVTKWISCLDVKETKWDERNWPEHRTIWMANEKSVIFPDVWSTQNLTPQYLKAFRRVDECFIFLLGFSCVMRQSSLRPPVSTGLEKQWFPSAKWSQLPTGQGFVYILWHFQDMNNSLRSSSRRCVMRHMCLPVYYIHLNMYHQVWCRTGNRSMTEVELHKAAYPFGIEKLGKKEYVTFQGNNTASWTHCWEWAYERSSEDPAGKEQDVSQIRLSSCPPLKAKLFRWYLWRLVVWEFKEHSFKWLDYWIQERVKRDEV